MSKKTLLLETVADIAYLAGQHGYYSGDSRQDMQIFINTAKEFEKETKGIDWEDSRRDYIIEVEDFAKKHLKLPTLNNNLNFVPDAALEPWDNIEMNGCIREDENNIIGLIGGEEDEPEFWSVYLHQAPTSTDGGGVQCIADLPTEELAIKFRELLKNAVLNYSEQGHLK